nr:hypothetical protein BgiMline_022932 [Biomphalaria glabrata]
MDEERGCSLTTGAGIGGGRVCQSAITTITKAYLRQLEPIVLSWTCVSESWTNCFPGHVLKQCGECQGGNNTITDRSKPMHGSQWGGYVAGERGRYAWLTTLTCRKGDPPSFFGLLCRELLITCSRNEARNVMSQKQERQGAIHNEQ